MGGLGGTYLLLNQHQDAVDIHNQALEIRKRIFGDEYSDIFRYIYDLAEVHFFLGHYRGAIDFKSRR